MARKMNGLKAIIAGREITLRDLAQRLEIPYPTMLGYSNGYSRPSDETLDKIASLLGVSVRDLYVPPFRSEVLANEVKQ